MERLLERGPVRGAGDFAQSNFVIAFRIAALHGDQQLVAGLYGFARRKRGERQNAFSLKADIEQDGISGKRDDGGFNPAAAFFVLRLVRVALLELRKNVFEGFAFSGGLYGLVFWI